MRSNQAFDPHPTLAAPPNETGDQSDVFEQAAVALIGVEGTQIAAFNTAAEQLFYRSAHTVRGMELSDLFACFQAEQIAESLRLASRGIPSFPSLLATRGHAAPTEVDVRVGPLSVGGEIVGATVVVLDVRTQNRSVRELRADRDVARAAEAEAVHALNAVEVDDSKEFPNAFAPTPRVHVDGKRDHDTLVPGLLIERALPQGSRGVLDLSEALFQRYDGQPRAMFRVVRELLERACQGGSIRLKAQIQAARADWSLLRVELIENVAVERSDQEWTLLRRRVTALEGGLGHEPHGHDKQRIWMTFNLKSLGLRSSRPPHPALSGLNVALDVRSEELFQALSARLRAWKACPVRYSPSASGDVVISDTQPSSARVIRLGADIAEPVVRSGLRDALLAWFQSTRSRAHPDSLREPSASLLNPLDGSPPPSDKNSAGQTDDQSSSRPPKPSSLESYESPSS